ncbi:MAG: TetR/AcrR family transcriptional regulator [Actinomycetota bacterium]|nr:TetR/AcrR family transcriptional regulator [Actinomycetota bacterium]
MSTSGAVRRGRPGHDISTVLATSVDVFNERGFDGTSIEDLSRRLKISKSAIYHHIDSKDALLGLALDHALTGLEEVASAVRALDGPAIQRLETLLRGSVTVLVERLPYVTLLLRVRGNSDVERQALTRRRRLDRLAAELVKQSVGDGDLRPDIDPAVTARLLFGMVNSLTEWLRPGGKAPDIADAVATVAFDGLRAPRQP